MNYKHNRQCERINQLGSPEPLGSEFLYLKFNNKAILMFNYTFKAQGSSVLTPHSSAILLKTLFSETRFISPSIWLQVCN